MARLARVVVPGYPHHITRARERAGRHLGAGESAGGGGVELAAILGDRGGGSDAGGDSASRADGPTLGRLAVPAASGEAPGPTAPPPKTRPQTLQGTKELGIVSPELCELKLRLATPRDARWRGGAGNP